MSVLQDPQLASEDLITVEIEVDVRKSARENAADYYESAKRARRKAESAKSVLVELEKKLAGLERGAAEAKIARATPPIVKKKVELWFEKFRWFFTSEGFLAVGGRSAEQNEVLVKKHMQEGDVVFHTDISGSPFVILKGGEKGDEKSLEEAAKFTASYSSAWKAGLGGCEVYWVKPEQVSKKAPAGEYIAKGAFMIYGKKNYFHRVPLETAIGWDQKSGAVVYGPLSALASREIAHTIILNVGETEQLELAKKIRKILEEKTKSEVPLEDVQKALPPGKSRIVVKQQ